MSGAADASFDLVIVGSGAAGLTCAITAARAGLKPLVIEKEAQWGGSTSLSGGGVWAPLNPIQQAAGRTDSREAVLAYLDEVITEPTEASSPERRQAFLAGAPDMVADLVDAGLRWTCSAQPDYLPAPHAGVGRCLSTRISDGRPLGPWLATMRRAVPPHPVELDEARKVTLGWTSLSSAAMMAKVFLRGKLKRLRGEQPLSMGASLAGQLMMAARRLGVEVRLNTRLEELVIENGAVSGLVAQTPGGAVRYAAPCGVVLCAGGFARNAALRARHQRADGTYSSASPGDTGDTLAIAEAVQARTELLDEAWWGTTYMMPGDVPVFCLSERSLPHAMMVDDRGERFTNESADYYSIGKAMLARGIDRAWLILDARHRQRYLFTGMLPGRTPQALIDAGFFLTAGDIGELAKKCDIDAATLAASVERFNRFAASGTDTDFHRGEGRYDRFWSDPSNRPNPCLGTIEQAPLLACRIYLGDLGTKGGLVTDRYARVIAKNGLFVPGLYASGNCTASVFARSYPGPGATLGPAMVFGYIAAKHMAARAGR